MKPQTSNSYRLWIGVRFVIFGVGGLCLLLFSGLHLFLRTTEHAMKPLLHPMIGMGLLVIASLSILYGSGRWGRWLFLPVWLAFPFIFLSLMFGFAKLAPHADKNVGCLFVVIAMSIPLSGLWLIDFYYRRGEIENGSDK